MYQELFLERYIILFLQNPNGLSEWYVFSIVPWTQSSTMPSGFTVYSHTSMPMSCYSFLLYDKATQSPPLWPFFVQVSDNFFNNYFV